MDVGIVRLYKKLHTGDLSTDNLEQVKTLHVSYHIKYTWGQILALCFSSHISVYLIYLLLL